MRVGHGGEPDAALELLCGVEGQALLRHFVSEGLERAKGTRNCQLVGEQAAA